MTFKEIRRQQYAYHRGHDKSLYTWFKACLYMEGASILVYLCQFTPITPNCLTICYGLLGVIGGTLLALGKKEFLLTAILIFYFKGILDWSDGHLARITNKETILGHRLDIICGRIGTIAFYTGLLMYISHKLNFYYLPLLAPFFYLYRKKLPRLDGRARTIDFILLCLFLDFSCFLP